MMGRAIMIRAEGIGASNMVACGLRAALASLPVIFVCIGPSANAAGYTETVL